MNTTPIICQGDELEGVLADIRERGGIVTSLSTGVEGNAGYSVSYFERAQELDAQGVRGDKMSAMLTPGSHSKKTLQSGATPDALTSIPIDANAVGDQSRDSLILSRTLKGGESARHITTKLNVVAGDDERAEKPKSALDAPASIFESPGADKSRMEAHPKSNPASAEPNEQDEAGGITQRNSDSPGGVESSNRERRDDLQLPHCPTCSGPVTQGMACPICAGLERIKAGARRFRNRLKTSTREARLPYSES